ncbi:hypothetical protein SKAU_G00241970 [Synaphobranchus kaupii]|uniref:Reverse transcriptase/retrotransposon-derived protein RNase H-like domain-containing protein n=1 Tax=Synaphobranchus kaupii TaxID=118154 RepID=A0A9Q1IUF7_SYNKA|nr:hypothetical protein SKAU_G00241970 [Synaphobranchus kaupii]
MLYPVATGPTKIDAVSKWQRPNHVAELRSFLSFASYYRRFVDGFAKLAAPLHQLAAELSGTETRKKSEQNLMAAWTTECEQSFEGVKSKLVEAPVLAYASFSLPFILEMDASHSGLGAVLSQEQDGSRFHHTQLLGVLDQKEGPRCSRMASDVQGSPGAGQAVGSHSGARWCALSQRLFPRRR